MVRPPSAWHFGVHASNTIVLGCRLVDGCTWDRLLSTVSLVSLSYKLLRGLWSVGLGQAAARLQGSCSLMTFKTPSGYSWVRSTTSKHRNMWKGCGPSCGACQSCLKAAQVDTPGCTELWRT